MTHESDRETKIQFFLASREMEKLKNASAFLGADIFDFVTDAIAEKVKRVEGLPFPPDFLITPHDIGDRDWTKWNLVVSEGTLKQQEN